MRHAVIMAGGTGTRLWPMSRAQRPKQLLRLFGGKSLLRQSYERLALLLPPESIYVITGAAYLPRVAAELPELPQENLFGEPVGRDTVNAVGLAAAILHQRDPQGCMGIFTADHIINPVDIFSQSVDAAFNVIDAHPDALITFGIRPTSPNTSYGYVKRGKAVAEGVFEVEKFTEKPNITAATRYVAGGRHYWNSGMFTWRLTTILEEIKRHLPNSYDGLMICGRDWDTPKRQETMNAIYPDLLKISIDFAVMERAQHVLVVEMNCQWVDVGSWTALEQVVGGDDAGNLAIAENTINLGSRGNIIVSDDDHLIATIGVDDMVIVHAGDATLICTKRDAQGIKELVAKIRERYGDKYL
ncbi:MAG: sugar phosphate nucleotidyltransferase [Phycisphaerae bacterium]